MSDYHRFFKYLKNGEILAFDVEYKGSHTKIKEFKKLLSAWYPSFDGLLILDKDLTFMEIVNQSLNVKGTKKN